jgi:predicted enzyme related to lactoylglutathione lyase
MVLALTAASAAAALASAQQPPVQAVSASGNQEPAKKALTMLGAAVPVADLDRALAFYTKGLGMKSGYRMDQKEVIEVPLTFPGGGPYYVLIWSKAPNITYSAGPVSRRIIFDVPDIRALEAQLKANGYGFQSPIHEIAQFHTAVAQLDDPDGNHIELVQRTP